MRTLNVLGICRATSLLVELFAKGECVKLCVASLLVGDFELSDDPGYLLSCNCRDIATSVALVVVSNCKFAISNDDTGFLRLE